MFWFVGSDVKKAVKRSRGKSMTPTSRTGQHLNRQVAENAVRLTLRALQHLAVAALGRGALQAPAVGARDEVVKAPDSAAAREWRFYKGAAVVFPVRGCHRRRPLPKSVVPSSGRGGA